MTQTHAHHDVALVQACHDTTLVHIGRMCVLLGVQGQAALSKTGQQSIRSIPCTQSIQCELIGSMGIGACAKAHKQCVHNVHARNRQHAHDVHAIHM